MKEPVWFPAKRYGWGWGLPECWQGWAVLAVYASLIAASFLMPGHAFRLGSMIAFTVILVFVCWLKGERPRWRWGGEDHSVGRE